MTPARLPHPLSPASRDGELRAPGFVYPACCRRRNTGSPTVSLESQKSLSGRHFYLHFTARTPGHAVSKWQSPDSNPSSLLSTKEIPM